MGPPPPRGVEVEVLRWILYNLLVEHSTGGHLGCSCENRSDVFFVCLFVKVQARETHGIGMYRRLYIPILPGFYDDFPHYFYLSKETGWGLVVFFRF